jgi:hypothetical protein
VCCVPGSSSHNGRKGSERLPGSEAGAGTARFSGPVYHSEGLRRLLCLHQAKKMRRPDAGSSSSFSELTSNRAASPRRRPSRRSSRNTRRLRQRCRSDLNGLRGDDGSKIAQRSSTTVAGRARIGAGGFGGFGRRSLYKRSSRSSRSSISPARRPACGGPQCFRTSVTN